MEKIVKRLVEELKGMIGAEISFTQLFNWTYHVNCIRDCEIEGIKISHNELFKIFDAVEKEAKKQGIYFDFSKYYGQCVGLPFAIPFVVKVKRPKTVKYITNFNKKLNEVKNLTLYVTSFSEPRNPVEITFEGDTIYRLEKSWQLSEADYDEYYKYAREILEISKKNFIYELEEINIASWDKEYIDREILDDTQWNFEIEYNDGKKKKYHGSNDFPDGFEELCKLFGIDLGWDDEDDDYEEED